MENFVKDLKFSLRMFFKTPGFTIPAVGALALGIGMNTAIFSLVNTVLLRPLPYPDPARIVVLTTSSLAGSISAASPIKFNLWRQQTTVFQDVSAYRYDRVNMTGVDHPELIQSAVVSANYFRLFGLSIARGRTFSADEDRPNGGHVVVLSDAFCKRVFGGDTRIIGKTISLGGRPYEVIGITATRGEVESPATFDPLSAKEMTNVWMPFQIDPDSSDQNGYFSVAARLKPGVTITLAGAQLKLTTQEFRRKSNPFKTFWTISTSPPRRSTISDGGR